MRRQIILDGQPRDVEVQPDGRLTVDGEACDADVVEVEPGVFSVLLDGKSFEVALEIGAVWVGNRRFDFERRDPRKWAGGQSGGADHGTVTLKAAMPGKVVEILVEPGDPVETGQGVLVVEAMKMQNEVKSPKGGVVQAVRVEPGESVGAGQALVVVE